MQINLWMSWQSWCEIYLKALKYVKWYWIFENVTSMWGNVKQLSKKKLEKNKEIQNYWKVIKF